ncbi:ribonuclease PH [Bacillus cereus]|nr:ribonuclease PH [Bacillus cereus]PFO71326.1 ribonuclease PH [Bacillus cereus]PFS76141.1 ribonuclease PH [Bacillus cereus]PGS44990.1 ribonuclease PH [Bacillus cereus]
MIIINYYSTLIDKDYHCQHKTHTFSRKNKKRYKKDSFFFVTLYLSILFTFISL